MKHVHIYTFIIYTYVWYVTFYIIRVEGHSLPWPFWSSKNKLEKVKIAVFSSPPLRFDTFDLWTVSQITMTDKKGANSFKGGGCPPPYENRKKRSRSFLTSPQPYLALEYTRPVVQFKTTFEEQKGKLYEMDWVDIMYYCRALLKSWILLN